MSYGMRSLFCQKGKMTPQLSNAYNSFTFSTVSFPYKMDNKGKQSIQNGLKDLFSNGIGLQSILRNDGNNIIDRTLIEDTEGCKPCPSDTKSTKSESNSLQTYQSSASNGMGSKQSNIDVITPTSINDEDLIQKYYKELRNSLKNCILNKQPAIRFKDIAGNTYAKKTIQEAFVLPNLMPEYFNGKPKPWNKILLYGPPGVGKTMMARALGSEVNATVLWVSLADITSKYIGESEKLLRMLFELAREKSPSIIIIDEMDSIGRKRNGNESETERRIKTEFLRQMDEINSAADGVYVLATTNMPWELDIAALRRFERRILLPMPDLGAREEILRLHIGNHPHDLSDKDFQYLAKATEGYSGSDISNVVNDALLKPVRSLQEATYFKIVNKKQEGPPSLECEEKNDNEEGVYKEYYVPCLANEEGAVKIDLRDIPKEQRFIRNINIMDLKDSIKNCRPTVSPSLLSLYNKFLLKYGHIDQKGDLFQENKEYQHYYL